MRTAFYISDGTALTSETFGHAILSLFPVKFRHRTLPFIDDETKAQQTVEEINQAFKENGERPLIFHTFIDSRIKKLIVESEGVSYDFLDHYTAPVQKELNVAPEPRTNRTHGIHQDYIFRIEAVNYTLANDDGVTTRNYDEADIILIGASRTGKTPTCLYLALQYGIKAANYPLTEEDMTDLSLPYDLKMHRHKLFGLTIDPERLQQIRDNRRANSRYASMEQCVKEIEHIEQLYRREAIPFLNSTHASVEEIAAKIMTIAKLERHRY
ncbi:MULTISPECIES: pyruvate, water dikinase regulatory protein [Gammaproteobacteria]|uniref:posphoenolpyruvate synthetase regulatory kinase/phosphorylase PpsR n=1 Tax=Gammaproteobacteria TaxID=1236 RepID=UPI000DCFD0C0|nr:MULTISPECIES: pyruvate, water dikinase regulatory protein [Gammaproteobacteria]RTE87260.1 kinase/pyrophosphorylase [Aliidiomarina sp. B3213]TCZ92953.1 kinase/pyrophosphorylase [Lysobacter sp. N42]